MMSAQDQDRIKWFRRLKRCIADIPPDTAVLVRHGSVELITPAMRHAAIEADGCLDKCETIDMFIVRLSHIEPAGEGL